MPKFDRRVQFATAALLVSGLLFGVASPARAAAGDLDPTFGTDGRVTTDFGGRNDFPLAVAIQPDGKIVAAGNSSVPGVFSVDFALARYHPDGSLDGTFGAGGTVLSDFGAPLDAASDVVVQLDGKIVAAGVSSGDFAVARYDTNGTLDATFGTGGLVKTDFGSFDQATAVALDPAGRIVLVGLTGGAIAMARYAPLDGSLDPTFGSGGLVVTDLGSGGQAVAMDVAVGGEGKITVGGGVGSFPSGSGDFAVARFTADGSLDASFGSGGVVTTDFGASERAFGLALESDGSVTMAGGTNPEPSSGNFALARYNADGSLDTTFGTGGTVTTDFSDGSPDIAFGVVVHPDGGITAAGGTSSAPGSSSFALARYTSSGGLDGGFGSGGKVTTSFDRPFSNGLDVVAQADGKVVVAGGNFDPATGAGDFALARYLGAPSATTVVVDVKPGNEDNVVPLQSNGVVPVAILTTDSFDATSVDPASVCFGDAEDASGRDCTTKHGHSQLVDVNGDARPDLLLHYEIEETGIDPGDTQACLTGATRAGAAIEGCDRIVTK